LTRLNQSLKGRQKVALTVIPGRGRGPVGVVNAATERRRREQQGGKFSKSDGDEVYALIDVEPHDSSKAAGLAEALQIARLEGVHVLLSNPSFEFWLLCHVAEASAACHSFRDPTAVDRELMRLSKHSKDDFHRNPNLFACLLPKVSHAVDVAQHIHQKHHQDGPDLRVLNPCTEVYLLVGRLI
jgi:hypothetical protein